jgi:hypothetical protein
MANVEVFLGGNGKPDWSPQGLIHLKLGESLTWSHSGTKLKVEFRRGHPFEESIPFELERGRTKVTKVRNDESLRKKTFPCFVTLDGQTREFTEKDGVIID